jgi:hypothetical protein
LENGISNHFQRNERPGISLIRLLQLYIPTKLEWLSSENDATIYSDKTQHSLNEKIANRIRSDVVKRRLLNRIESKQNELKGDRTTDQGLTRDSVGPRSAGGSGRTDSL